MAWTEKTTVKGKIRYHGRYRTPDGKKQRLATTYPTKLAAKQAATTEELQSQQPEPRQSSSTMPWGEWVEQWWSRRDIDVSTAYRDGPRCAKHVTPAWKDTPLNEITRSQIQEWVHSLTDNGLAPSSVQKCFYLLSSSLKAATIADLIPGNPCFGVSLPRDDFAEPRFLTADEFNAICKHLTEPWRTFVRFLVGTGLRFSEAAGLHWYRLDLDAGIAEIRDTCDITKREIVPRTKTTSNGTRSRSIPLMDWVVEDLRTHLEQSPLTGRCLTPHRLRPQQPASPCSTEQGLVFTNRDGGAVSYYSFRRNQFLPALQSAGVSDATIKDLRHTYASWALQQGQTIYSVRDLLGHDSVKTTERYYGNLDRTQWSSIRATFADPAQSSSGKMDPKSAPDFAPENGLISDSKIVDLDRFRRSE